MKADDSDPMRRWQSIPIGTSSLQRCAIGNSFTQWLPLRRGLASSPSHRNFTLARRTNTCASICYRDVGRAVSMRVVGQSIAERMSEIGSNRPGSVAVR